MQWIFFSFKSTIIRRKVEERKQRKSLQRERKKAYLLNTFLLLSYFLFFLFLCILCFFFISCFLYFFFLPFLFLSIFLSLDVVYFLFNFIYFLACLLYFLLSFWYSFCPCFSFSNSFSVPHSLFNLRTLTSFPSFFPSFHNLLTLSLLLLLPYSSFTIRLFFFLSFFLLTINIIKSLLK